MSKLLLCSALIAPCLILPFSASSFGKQDIVYDKVSFEEAYIEPELDRLDNCQSADLDIFFHENYITTHTAEYIAEGIELSSNCKNINYVISPIVPASSGEDARELLNIQTQELSLILEAHGVKATVSEPQIQSDFNSLSANGRTAILKINISDGDGDSA